MDAGTLPFADGRFDGVISTSGAMLAGDQQQAANQSVRVFKIGGRLVQSAWDPGGTTGEFFVVSGRQKPAPPPPVSPIA